MTLMELVGLNTKGYRYQRNITQEQFANKTKFKMTYFSTIENKDANLTCKNIDFIAESFKIKVELLFIRQKTFKIELIFTTKRNNFTYFIVILSVFMLY